jgi:hypothetical protein
MPEGGADTVVVDGLISEVAAAQVVEEARGLRPAPFCGGLAEKALRARQASTGCCHRRPAPKMRGILPTFASGHACRSAC